MSYASYNPFYARFSITDTNVYDLKTLLNTLTVKPGFLQNSSGVARCCYLKVKSDVGNGGAYVYVGNPATLTTSQYGDKLAATQYSEINSDSNLIILSQVAVLVDTNPTVVEVTILVR